MLPQKPSFFLKSSTIYFVFSLLLVSTTVVYGIFQFRIFRAESAAIIDNENRIVELGDIMSQEKDHFKKVGEMHAERQRDFEKKIESILPTDENYIDLTRLLDNYFAEQDTASNPIVVSSLRFGKGAPLAYAPGIYALPISMNIEATRDNFFKFLEFVKNSGSLDTGVRLMHVTSIQLNFPEGGEVVKDLKQKINFTVEMNAYYQTPKTER